MKLEKQNVRVFIEDEPQLQQARELLERYGQTIAGDGTFSLTPTSTLNNLRIVPSTDEWFLGLKGYCDEITLSELEEILKEEKDNAEFTYNSDGSVSISLNAESEKQRDQVNEFFDPDYRDNRRKWNEAIENSKTGLFVVDKHGNITELK